MLLVPYNNAMRLGQGFNTYTHQLCIDNAVVVDPERAENAVTNDGVTMRILAQKMKKASVWRQMAEYVGDGQLATSSSEPNPDEVPPSDAPASENQPEFEDDQDFIENQASILAREDEERSAELRRLNAEKKPLEDNKKEAPTEADPTTEPKHEELNQEQVDAALSKEAEQKKADEDELTKAREKTLKGFKEEAMNIVDSKAELEKKRKERTKRMMDRPTGMAKSTSQRRTWSMDRAIGTSQMCSYSSRFVDKLSEVNDEMSGSAALSIKSGAFFGSGNGAFINTDKFYDSHVRFMISVRVVNQSIQYKDCLQYNPVRSVSEANADRFKEVFGDGFLSGFVEGGELHAVVLMKIKNDAQKKDIMAEAEVALTNGLELDGKGNVALAKQNIEMNTETSIYVRYAGGASIKSYNEDWTIDSLMAAAQRFPYLVSQFPQRTYAIVTKYTSLRSFMKLKPAKLSPLKYENAALYTSTLLDAFMEFRTLHRRITNDIRAVQAGVKRFKVDIAVAESERPVQSASLEAYAKSNNFTADIEGLDCARNAIRKLMNAIVREVDAITVKPELATDTNRNVIAIGPASFKTLIPVVEFKVRKIRGTPLSTKLVNNEVKDIENLAPTKSENVEVHLFDQSLTTLALSETEQIKVADMERDDPELAETGTRVTPPVGSLTTGTMFCTVDLGLQKPIITEIHAGHYRGVLLGLSITYSNGLTATFGDDLENYHTWPEGAALPQDERIVRSLLDLSSSEVVVSATVEVDGADDELTVSVVGVSFLTNKGRALTMMSTVPPISVPGIKGHHETHTFERPITGGYLSGLWGRHRSSEDANSALALAENARIGEVAAEVQVKIDNVVNSEAAEQATADQVTPSDPKNSVAKRAIQGARINRLGFVWSQAAPSDTLFDDELPIECYTSDAVLSQASETVSFPCTFPGVPQLLWGIRNLTFKGEGPRELKATIDRVERYSFQYSLSVGNCDANYGWMVPPELSDMNIQCGQVTFKTEGYEQISTVTFELPFGNDPDVICWITGFETQSELLDIKVGAVRATGSSFDLKVTSSSGSLAKIANTTTSAGTAPAKATSGSGTSAAIAGTSASTTTSAGTAPAKTTSDAGTSAAKATPLEVSFNSVTVAWMARDATKRADSVFASGNFENSVGSKGKSVQPIEYNAPFKGKPKKHFVAFCALQSVNNVPNSWAIDTTTATASHLNVEITAPPGTAYGAVWISSL